MGVKGDDGKIGAQGPIGSRGKLRIIMYMITSVIHINNNNNNLFT